MPQPLVTAIIVNYRTPALTLALIDSLRPVVGSGLRFVVVENGSEDDSAAQLERAFRDDSSVELIVSGENLGFTGGINLGGEHALAASPKPAFLWLLNPDAGVTLAALDELVEVAFESGAGVVSACNGGQPGGWVGEDHFPRAFWGRPVGFQLKDQSGRRWWRSPISSWRARCRIRMARFRSRPIGSMH